MSSVEYEQDAFIFDFDSDSTLVESGGVPFDYSDWVAVGSAGGTG